MVDKYKLYYRTFMVIFWVTMCFGFVAENLFPPLDALKGPILLVCDCLMVILGVITLHKRSDVVIFFSFLLITVLSTIILNHLSTTDFFNGSRDFIGLFLTVPVFRWFFRHSRSAEFVKSFDKQLFVWMVLQAICSPIQFALHGAGDFVGGTMGDGSSGMLSMLLYLTSYYFVSKNWDEEKTAWQNIKANWIYIFLLFPSMINETKASFIYITIYVFLLMRYDRNFVLRALYIFPIFIISIVLVCNIYADITNQDADEVFSIEYLNTYLWSGEESIDNTVDIALKVQDGFYDMSETGVWVEDIPRFAKIFLVWPILDECPGGIWLGAGVGQFKGGRMMEKTEFASKNQWLLNGTKVWLFFLLVELGLFGVLWFCGTMINVLFQGKTHGHWAKRLRTFLLLDTILIFLYDSSFRSLNFCIVFFFLVMIIYYQTKGNASDSATKDLSLNVM